MDFLLNPICNCIFGIESEGTKRKCRETVTIDGVDRSMSMPYAVSVDQGNIYETPIGGNGERTTWNSVVWFTPATGEFSHVQTDTYEEAKNEVVTNYNDTNNEWKGNVVKSARIDRLSEWSYLRNHLGVLRGRRAVKVKGTKLCWGREVNDMMVGTADYATCMQALCGTRGAKLTYAQGSWRPLLQAARIRLMEPRGETRALDIRVSDLVALWAATHCGTEEIWKMNGLHLVDDPGIIEHPWRRSKKIRAVLGEKSCECMMLVAFKRDAYVAVQ